jgi:hypothetical protein
MDDNEFNLDEDELLDIAKLRDEYCSRPRLDNFLWKIDHVVKSHNEYYDLIGEIIMVCRVFDDEEIRYLADLVRTKWRGKPGTKNNDADERFVFDEFIAAPGMNDQEGPPRFEAIKIIMDKRGKTNEAAAKLYDKVMRSYQIPSAKRGRKKRKH